jgi:mannose-binding lectin 2
MLSATRCFAAFYTALFFSLLSTLPSAYAAADTQVANRTIERVSSPSSASCPGSVSRGRTRRIGTYAHVLQTVQLRTHSIHPPYIDEDLQNRYVSPGSRLGKEY